MKLLIVVMIFLSVGVVEAKPSWLVTEEEQATCERAVNAHTYAKSVLNNLSQEWAQDPSVIELWGNMAIAEKSFNTLCTHMEPIEHFPYPEHLTF